MDSQGRTWFISTFSKEAATCVEVHRGATAVLMRDSKDTGPAAERPTLAVATAQWPAVLAAVLTAESATVGGITITVAPDGSAGVTNQAVTLAYHTAEWNAFIKGVADGQFDLL